MLIGVGLAVWLGLAAWAVATGLKLRRGAGASGEQAARMAAMLDQSPAQPILVRADGRVEAAERIGDWLGLGRVPNFIADFAGTGAGLTEDDAAVLGEDVAAVQRGGKPFLRALRVQESSRVLMFKGAPAPPGVAAAGGAMLWVFDLTDKQREVEQLRDEVTRTTRAFESLAALIEAAPVPMWHRGPDLRLTLVNSAYVRAVEAEGADDAINRGLELVETASGKSPIAAAAAAREQGLAAMRTVPATIAGERRMMRIVDVPLGEIGVAGYALDIDELEQAQVAFRRFVETQRDTLDRLSAGVAQFGADRALVFSNIPFQRMFAMRPEWLADRPEFDRVLERMREAGRVPEARDFPAWKAERRGWFNATGGAIEESWLLPGGLHLRVVGQPLPDGGLLLIFEDRTEQVQLASARDILLRVRSATFDNLFEAIGVFEADGRLHLWNNRFRDIWGFEEEFLAGHPRVDALAEQVAAKLSNPSRAAVIRELVRSATIDRKQRSGRVAFTDGRHFEFAAVPLPDGNALFTMLDISDSRRIERALRDRTEALEASDRVKTAFVANMSYELRTPLTSIGGFAEMLSSGYAGELSAQARDYVTAILDSVGRLGTLIDDVLDLTQSEAGELPPERETVDVVQLARGAAAAIESSLSAKSQELAIDVHASAGAVTGDAKRLRQAVDNLLRNAVAYTQPGGRVLIHASGDKDKALIVVSDNGPGMDVGAQTQALDRFSRVGEQRDGDAALGLGLPLARQFVEAHGGTLRLLSEPGHGTAVSVELPRR